MTGDEDDELAAGLALGTLMEDERDAAIARKREDAAFHDRVDQWERLLAPLGTLLPPVEPPPGLFGKIERRLRRAARPQALKTVRAHQGRWRQLQDGVEFKHLRVDQEAGTESLLLRMSAKAVYAEHDHAGFEETFVIEGDLNFGALRLSAGDYHYAPAGSSHVPATTENGCLVLLIRAV